MRRVDSIKEICSAGLDIRVWCFACARGVTLSAGIWQRFEARGWSHDLGDAPSRFRCSQCRSSAAVAIYPASLLEPLPMLPTGASIVEWLFHSQRKKRKPIPGADRILRAIEQRARDRDR